MKAFKIFFTIFVLILTILIGYLIQISGGDLVIYMVLLVPLILIRFIKSMLEIDLF
jgi:hypothetical protein